MTEVVGVAVAAVTSTERSLAQDRLAHLGLRLAGMCRRCGADLTGDTVEGILTIVRCVKCRWKWFIRPSDAVALGILRGRVRP